MNRHRVSYVFFFFAIAITVEAEQSGTVSIKDTTVILTCPCEEGEEPCMVTWNGKGPPQENTLTMYDYNEKNDGLYSCQYSEDGTKKDHYFYIKAKVCDGCVDLDMNLALVAVFADVLLTLLIVFMVYYCTNKKAGTAVPQRPTQARQPRGPARGPPPPDPDYQPLNPTTRSTDVYATAHRR